MAQEKPSEKNPSKKNFGHSRKVFLYAFSAALPILIGLIGLIRGGFAPFGNKDVMTAGGFAERLNFFQEFHQRVRAGEPLLGYSRRYGEGYSFGSAFAMFLSNPAALLSLLFPESAMESVINVVYILLLGCAGFTFSIFLQQLKAYLPRMAGRRAVTQKSQIFSKRKVEKNTDKKDEKKSEKKDIAIGTALEKTAAGRSLSSFDFISLGFSSAYALSGFALSAGLNPAFLCTAVLFPLFMTGFLHLEEEKKWMMYALSLAFILITGFETGVIAFLFSIFFFFLYNYHDFQHFTSRIGYKLLGDAVACIISLFWIRENLTGTFAASVFHTGSDRAAHLLSSPFDALKSLFTKMPSSLLSTHAYGADMFCGAAVLFLLVCFFTNPSFTLWKKIRSGLLLGGLFSASFVSSLNHAANGFRNTGAFSSQTSVTDFSFIFIFLLLTVSFEALSALKYSTSLHLALAGGLSLTAVVLSLIFCSDYDSASPFVTTMEFLFFYFLVTILWKNRSLTTSLQYMIFGVLIFTEIILSYSGNISAIGRKADTYAETDAAKYMVAENHIHATDPEAAILVYTSRQTDSNPVTEMLGGYDYVITKKGTEDVSSTLKKRETFGDVDIYENPYALRKGFLIQGSALQNWDYDIQYPFWSINTLLTSYMHQPAPFRDADAESSYQMRYDNINDLFSQDPYKKVPTTYELDFKTEGGGDLYAAYEHPLHIGKVKEHSEKSIEYVTETDEDMTARETVFFDENTFKSIYESLNGNDALLSEGNFSAGSAAGRKDLMLVLPLSADTSWKLISGAGNTAGTSSFTIAGSKMLAVPACSVSDLYTLRYRDTAGSILLLLGIFVLVACAAGSVYMFCLKKKKSLSAAAATSDTAAAPNNSRGNVLRPYLVTIGITSAMFLLYLLLIDATPIGKNSLLTSDGYLQNYPVYTYLFRSIRHGTLGRLNFRLGYVSDNFANYNFLLNPLNWIMILFPDSLSLLAYHIVFYLKFILPGPALIFYLSHRPGDRLPGGSKRLIAFGLAYNLSAFAISFLNFMNFIEVAFFVPVMIYLLESLVVKRKHIPAYTLLLAWGMAMMNYYAFLLCEFLLLYFLVMNHSSVKRFFRDGIVFAGSSILSAGLAGCFLIPYYLITSHSGYTAGYDQVPALSLQNSLLQNLLDFRVLHRDIVITANDAAANVYCGILCLQILGLYALNTDISPARRIRQLILAFLIYFSFGNPLLHYITHGLHNPSMVPNRLSIFLIFLLIQTLFECMVHYRSLFTKNALIAYTVWSALIFAGEIAVRPKSSAALILTLLFIAGYYAAYLFFFFRRRKKYGYTRVVLLLLCLELVISAVYTGRNSFGADAASYSASISETEALFRQEGITDISSPGVRVNNRLHKDKMQNMAILSDYSSIDFFSSFYTTGDYNLTKFWDIGSDYNNVSFANGNPLAEIFLNEKYTVNTSGSDTPGHLKKAGSLKGITLYRNPAYVSQGILLKENEILTTMPDASLYTSAIDYQNAIVKKINGKNLYKTLKEADFVRRNKKMSYHISKGKTEDTDDKPEVTIEVSNDVQGDLYVSYYDTIYYLGTADGNARIFKATLPVLKNKKMVTFDDRITVALLDENVLRNLSRKLNDQIVGDLKYTSSSVSCSIQTDENGTIFFSFPEDAGWHATVDGRNVSIQSLYGGMGIPVKSGSHEIHLTYETPGLHTGILVSMVSLAVAGILLVVITGLRRRKRKKS